MPQAFQTPLLDAAQQQEQSSDEGTEDLGLDLASVPGTDMANGAPADADAAGDAEGAAGGAGGGGGAPEGNRELNATVEGEGQQGGGGGEGSDGVDAAMGEKGGEGLASEGQGQVGEAATAGGGAPSGAAGVTVTPQDAVAPAATPTLGGTAKLLLGAPSITRDEDQAILDSSGASASAHMAAAQVQLDQLSVQVDIFQAEAVAKADALSASTQSALSALSGEIQAGIASAVGGVSGAYTSASAALQGAAATAHASVDSAASSALAAMESSLASNKGLLTEQCVAAAEQVRAQETTWTQPFTDLEARYGEQFGQAASSAAAQVMGNQSAIASAFDGGGSAIDRAKGERKVKAAEKLVETGANRIRSEGPQRAAQAVAELNHAEIIRGFVAPLAQRADTFLGEGQVALDAAAQSARTTIEDGRVDAHAHIEADLTSGNADFDADMEQANQEVDVSGEQLESDLDTHINDTAALFTETAAAQAQAYVTFSESMALGMADLPFMTADQAVQFVAERELELSAFHDQNLANLEDVAGQAEGSILEEMRGGVDNLEQLRAQNDAEVQQLAADKVAAMQGVSSGFQDSLSLVQGAVSAELQRWTDPFGGQAEQYVTSAQVEVDARLAASDAALATRLSVYQGQLSEQVGSFATNISPDSAAESLTSELRSICRDAYSAMRGMGTDENKLFAALQKVDSSKVGAAVHEQWGRQYPGSDSLTAWLDDDLNSSEYTIATTYLAGNRAQAARLELEDQMHWYGDDEARVEAILRGLPPEEREQMRALPEWQATNARLQDNLGGTDINVTNALIVGNDARADAYRLRDKIDEARRDGDNDALHTALAGVDSARREQVIQEFHNVRNGVEASAVNVDPIDQAAANAEMVGYVTRDIEVTQSAGQGGTYTQTLSVTGANRDLAVALIEEGNDSMSADVARFEVERTRRGGPRESNMETALMMSTADQEAIRDPENPNHAAAVARQRTRSADFDAAWQAQYGSADNAPASVSDALSQTYQGEDNAELEVQAHQYMLQDGTNSPRVVAAVTQLSIDGAGTSEERMDRMWAGLTPAEADEATALWERDHGNGQTLDERLYGGTFSEMSGDEELQMRRRRLGDEKYFKGEYAERALQLADLEYQWTAGEESGLLGGLVMSGSDEQANLEIHHQALNELIDQVKTANSGKAFDPVSGAFLGTPEQYERYRELCAFVGINAALYRERQDSIANAITTGIAIVGAVIAAILTGGAATPLIAAAFAAGTGLAAMGANRLIKGSRYGWEQAAVDLGVTAVSAVTAGAGAYLNGLNRGADGVARGIFNSSTTGGRLAGQTTVAAGSGFVNSASGTAMIDETWEEGGQGAGGVFYSGLRGAGTGATSTYVGGRIGNTTFGQRMGNSTNGWARGAGNSVSNMGGTAASETLGLSMDAATGRYRGEFYEGVLQVGQSTLQNGGQSFLEGAGEAYHARRQVANTTTPASPPEVEETPAPQPVIPEEGPTLTASGAGDDAQAGEVSARPSSTPDASEAEVIARTQADPDVQSAVARVSDAEQRAAEGLESTDRTEASRAAGLDRRIVDNSETHDDGTVTTGVTRDEAQGEIDAMEANVTTAERSSFDDAQAAHSDASATIERVEAANRSDVESERQSGPTARLHQDQDAGEAQTPSLRRPSSEEGSVDAPDTTANRATAPENSEGSSDLAQEGGRALGMTSEEVDQMSSLSGSQLEEFARRARSGEDARLVLADLASGSRTATAPSGEQGDTTPVRLEDNLTDELVRLSNLGHFSSEDVEYVLGGADPAARSTRLEERRRAVLTTVADASAHYPDALREAHTTSDPDARASSVDDVIARFDLRGQGQAVAALRALDGSPDAQLELAHHLAVFRGLQGRDPTSLSDADIISLSHAHEAMLNTFVAGDAELRKVVDLRTVEGLISMRDRDGNATNTPSTSGSVADARNTEGMTPAQIVVALGLDYQGSDYITNNGDNTFSPVNSLYILEAPVTTQMMDAAQVPLHRDIRARMSDLAKQDSAVAHVLARSRGVNPGDFGDPRDPYTGFGFSAPGERFPGGEVTLNQELKMGAVTVPSGAQIFRMNEDGRRVLVATLLQNHDGTRHWAVSSDSPSDVAARLSTLADEGFANAQAARGG